MNKTHGMFGTRVYKTWSGIKQRCTNPKEKSYPRYGGRGITYCPEWETFEGFHAWAQSSGYRDNLEIDRIDNDGNYEPANCRWVDSKTNRRNTSYARPVTFYGETKLITDWVSDPRCPVSAAAVYYRMSKMGWDIEEALFTPSRNGN